LERCWGVGGGWVGHVWLVWDGGELMAGLDVADGCEHLRCQLLRVLVDVAC
jgi:hypothetical protein